MNFILDFFSSSSLLNKEKTEQEIPSKKKIKEEYWKVALPAAVEGVLLNLMLLADLIMVGTLGIEQAAAVGKTPGGGVNYSMTRLYLDLSCHSSEN